MSTNIASAAVDYINAGLEVIRLVPKTKDPFKGSHAYLDATANPKQVRQWWTDQPRSNIGIRPPAGVVVLDIDPRHGGDVELERMARFRGQLPETWTAHTGSGGFHMWYCVGGTADIRGKLCTGVDIKHRDNGYLVVPPSIHPNGRIYAWVTPPAGKPADAPVWLRIAIQKPAAGTPFIPTGNGAAGKGPYSLR